MLQDPMMPYHGSGRDQVTEVVGLMLGASVHQRNKYHGRTTDDFGATELRGLVNKRQWLEIECTMVEDEKREEGWCRGWNGI